MADKKGEEKMDKNFKVGDKIVRFGRVHEVFKIEEEKDFETEEMQEVIYFRPMYESSSSRDLICAIPVKNIDKTNMRRPMSDEKLKELMDLMDEKVEDPTKRFNTRQAKEVLKSNNPKKIALIMKRLAVVRRDPDTNFTYTKKRLYRKGMKRLQEEIALIKDMEISETRKMLEKLLKKQAKLSLPLEEEEED
jgi:RNA polymerase-interacting CarD/CdnL/TRCF family regulator